jgi:type IV pilus assembly protein PilY1
MKFIKIWLIASALMASSLVQAQIPAVPPNVTDFKKQPMVVLNMSKDHQLFYRAYNEYTDIDFDGNPDTTYKHSIDYYGYFDAYKCYDYVGGLFTPTRVTTDKYCPGVGVGSASQWSGNFLNWATMSRMDVVRKVLYGGYRSTDTASQTVLERSYLPNDAHSFAKFYDGSDLPKLTPFSVADVAPRTVTGVFTVPVGGITICNTTLGSATGANRYSQTNTNPPLMRVARGDFSLWNANERWQCQWNGEHTALNGNDPALTGLNAASGNPDKAIFGLPVGGNPDFNVRVEACKTGLIGKERCTLYPLGNYKPIGLMHEFGANDQAEFALITGSFAHNISGGVLRRNMNSFLTEFNKDTDGTFNAVNGIAYTLNKMRVYGYDHSDGTYAGDVNNGNWCTFQITGLSNNQCASWGNPLGEMYLESLRYLAGKSATSGFAAGAKDTALGLTTETWSDPYTRPNLTAAQRLEIERKFGKAQCRPMSVLNFNATAISYDADDLSGLSDLGNGSGNISNLLNTISSFEGISGTQRLVGRIAGGSAAQTNRLCDLKTVNSLANVDGLCPDAPAYRGSYSLAGLAYWAHTNRIRTDFTATKKGPLTVDTYSIALNPGVPVITVVAQDGSGNKALIQPAYRLQKSATEVGGGTLVDFRIITQTPTYGKYLIVWEDSEQGGDYDQDVTGILEYRVVGNQLKVTTLVFAAATVNPQGFGYILSGADKNGAHFHSGILRFNFTDVTNPTVVGTNAGELNASGGCNNCTNNIPPAPSTATYAITGGTLGALPDPLLLAAKWGGFKDSDTTPTGLPDNTNKWDVQKQDGSAGADGIPDNYSVVYRPDLLENALRSVFGKIIDKSNSAPATSVPILNNGGLKYTVDFSSETLSGKLQASVLRVSGTDTFAFDNPSIFGHVNLTAVVPSNLRQVITNVGPVGTEFTYADISTKNGGANYISNLGGTVTATTSLLIDYMRGDRSKEGGIFRRRGADSILGGIINSNPWIQGTQTFSLFGTGYEGYGGFGTSVKAVGDALLWVGSNDGMLHAFKAQDLMPVLSYVPEPLVPNVKKFADPSITSVTALMDGNPVTADINLGTGNTSLPADWRTYLFSALGRGAKGVFALDVTNTKALTQGRAADIFKWQFTDADDEDLGYVIADGGTNPDTGQAASVARLKNNRFAYIFGNGVSSKYGKAVLYILYVQGPGTDPATNKTTWLTGQFKKIILTNGSGNESDNGLMQPLLVDTNDDGIMDTIYAGDLKGNMWKVDISSKDELDWKVAYSNKPLYTAKAADNTTRLPITGAPSIAFHPQGGQVVVFATGQSIFTSDFPNTAVKQRIYGIWDKRSYKDTPGDIPTGTSELLERVWTVGADAAPVQTDKTAINWLTKKGWFVNIPYSSGMAIHNTLLAKDGTTEIGIPLIYPTALNINNEVCANNVNGAYVQIDAISGLQPSDIFGTDKVGFSTTDQNFTLVRYAPQTGSGPAQAIVGNTELKRLPVRTKVDTRLYWREIPGIKTLVNPDSDKQ